MLSCALLDEMDWPKYDALVRRSPHGSIFALSTWEADAIYGVFKGQELVAGLATRTNGRETARYVDGTPWQGIVSRSQDIGENLVVAESVIHRLAADFTEVTIFMPPQWFDTRPFTWAGFRLHAFYTYRGYGAYDKRVRVPSVPEPGSHIGLLEDWACVYYWRANEGGEHTYWLDRAIRHAHSQAKDFDMVGCNSPRRDLFKRGFGGRLTRYYAVSSNAQVGDLRAVPLAPVRSHEACVFYMPQASGGGECPQDVAAGRHDSLQGGGPDALPGV